MNIAAKNRLKIELMLVDWVQRWIVWFAMRVFQRRRYEQLPYTEFYYVHAWLSGIRTTRQCFVSANKQFSNSRRVSCTEAISLSNNRVEMSWKRGSMQEKPGTLKMRDMNLRDMKMRHHVAGVENARHENAKNAIVWNTQCCICLSIAEQECMSRQERAPDLAADCVLVND